MNDNRSGLMGFSVQPDSSSKGLELFKWNWLQIFEAIKVWEVFKFYFRHIWILFLVDYEFTLL